MQIDKNKIYYNTEYRKKIKALSKFNIFIKDRISKKDVILEKKKKIKKEILIPIIYKNLFNFYNLIKDIYNIWIYKKFYNIKLYAKMVELNNIFIKKKKNIYCIIKNQLILEYFFDGFIFFLMIINWLWMAEWNKWAALTDILTYSFFNLKVFLQYINNYFFEFFNYFFQLYNQLIFDFLYSLNILENKINIYNLFSLNILKIFTVFFNIEKIRLQHEKNYVLKKDWEKIRRVSFSYFNIDLLNNLFFLSFFSFCIYEFNIYSYKYNMHYITITFFEYWIDYIIEKNYKNYKKQKNKDELDDYVFNYYNLNDLYLDIFKKNFFKIRVKYNLFLSNIDYFIFFKEFTYNHYIRNNPYFIKFTSHKKLFLDYNNPTSTNKGSLGMWNYDKLLKKNLLLNTNINNNLNLFKINRIEPFYNFFSRYNKINSFYILKKLYNDFNIKFLYKMNYSNNFFFTMNKFFDFNLMDYYNLKNRLESYKDVMAIQSVYVYRFANSSFKTMDEFMFTIFKTPLENFIYFNELYKEFSYSIINNIFIELQKKIFLFDLYNISNIESIKNYSNFFRFFSRLFKTYIYFFKFYYWHNLLEGEDAEKLLRIDVFSKFYNIFEKKKIFLLIKKLKKKQYYQKWSIENFFNIIKYNSMFYLDIHSISILFSGWIYEMKFFSNFMKIIKLYNNFLKYFKYYNNYKYLISLKDFFFQLMYENIEYSLYFIFYYVKKNIYNIKYNYINHKNIINNNYIYRKYMSYAWFEHKYYDDLFFDLKKFTKENYSEKLSKWILRYFYKKAELHNFYSESLSNRYINNKRLFI